MYNKMKHFSKMGITSFRTRLFCCFVAVFFTLDDAHAQNAKSLGKYDGPYLFHEEGEIKLVRVEDGEIEIKVGAEEPFPVTTENGQHRFEVSLHPIKTPEWSYKSQGNIMVISDPHGDFESFYSILKTQKVIGDNYEWVFGKNDLVINGDVFDRGQDVLPIFWLIYKLEAEAEKVGGSVHFLLGNHEEMILRGNYKYMQDKYHDLADSLGKSYRDFWAINTELGKWLQLRNTMEKIDDHLFVHAGLSSSMLDPQWTIPAVNDAVRAHIFEVKEERQKSSAGKFLFATEGPLWYRGMVRPEEKYHPLSETELDKMLIAFDAKRIYLGHTIFPEVTQFYKGRVIAVNVNNESNRLHGRSRGVILESDKMLVIYDDIKKNKMMGK